MQAIFEFLQRVGLSSMDLFWFPLAIWTVVAILAFLILRYSKSLNPLYQYHLRVATIFAIPLGFITKYVLQFISTHSDSSTAIDPAIFVVINPLEEIIYREESTTSFAPNFFEPNFLLGVLTISIFLFSFILIIRLIQSLLFISRLHKKLNVFPLSSFDDFNFANYLNVKVAYLDHPMVPFTFGWRSPVIVLPKSIQDDPEKIRMAIQHELIHIKRGDYLLQLILSVIESVFWFHPIIRYGSKEIEIYREISCDQEVLNTSGISLKSYATMLLELLPLNRGFGSFSVNMAVQQSTLKKRISTMKNHKLYRNSIKRSILFYLLISIGIITPIACSDMRAPSALDESVLEEMSLTLTNPTFEINGKEVQTHSKSVSINGLDGFMFSVPDYGVFVVSPIQFEGGIQNGEIELNAIDFRVNNMNVTIRSKEVLSDNKIPVFVNHYPSLQGEQFIYGRLANQILVRENLASYLVPPSGPIDTKSTNSGNLPMLREIGSDEFVVVEQMPKLIGGMASIQSKIMYPEVAKREGIEGRVVVQFIVTETGEIESPQIVKGIGSGCDEAALEAVMQAKFEPGLQRGEPVRVQYSIPVIFRLDDSDFTGSNNIPTIKQIDHLALGDN